MSSLDIHEVAQRAGLPASTLRYYEQMGLIQSIGRRGLRRLFAPEVVERLALIGLGRVSGFSLEEIALMFGPDGRPHIDRGKLLAKADELDARIATLVRMRDGLRHAAACRATNHLECPTFQRFVCAFMPRATGPRESAAPSPRRAKNARGANEPNPDVIARRDRARGRGDG